MTPSVRKVTVVGGGMVGLCTAHSLNQAGYEVTVVERSVLGRGATWGNAGELAVSLAEPLPAPGMLRVGIRSLLNPDGALYIRPRLDPALLRFLIGFSRNTTRARYNVGVELLKRFAADSRELYTELDTAGALAPGEEYVYAYGSREAAETALRAKQAIGAPVPGGLIDRDSLQKLEPSLSSAAVAGFVVESQGWMDPIVMVEGLAKALRSRGVDIREGVRVSSVADGNSGAVVRTTEGDIESDAVVLASGLETRSLVRRLGVRLNLFPGKGYSFTVPADPIPNRVVNVGDAHVVLTPISGRLRVAGTMELDSDYDTLQPRRIDAIVNAVSPFLKSADWNNRTDEWVGTRVLTQDGLPAIGFLPGSRRILIATGHNMLGLVLAPATGRMIAQLLTQPATENDFTRAFSPSRIAKVLRRSRKGVPGGKTRS